MKPYRGPGRIRPCLAWRVDVEGQPPHLRETLTQARTVLGRLREMATYWARMKEDNARFAALNPVDDAADDAAFMEDE